MEMFSLSIESVDEYQFENEFNSLPRGLTGSGSILTVGFKLVEPAAQFNEITLKCCPDFIGQAFKEPDHALIPSLSICVQP